MSKENDKILEQATKETPLGWKVNLLNMLATSLMCLAEDIDSDLRKIKCPDGAIMHFDYNKKKQYNLLCSCLKDGCKQFQKGLSDATRWYDKLNIDGQVWEIVKGHSDMYDNFTCDAKELLQAMMLYLDRARTDDGYYSILRHMRSLPENGVFPEEEIQHFKFKRPFVPYEGASVVTQYGKGVIETQTNGDNWIVKLNDGTQKVLTSKQFTIDL